MMYVCGVSRWICAYLYVYLHTQGVVPYVQDFHMAAKLYVVKKLGAAPWAGLSGTHAMLYWLLNMQKKAF